MRIGVVIPCYNEEGNLDAMVEAFLRHRETLLVDLLFVNDGSSDGSAGILARLAAAHPWVRVVTHPRNMGLAAALKTGWGFAVTEGYDLIGQMDCDLTHPISLLAEMVRAIDKYDMVVASRYVPGGGMKNVPTWRVALSVIGQLVFRAVFRLRIRDTTSGFRLTRRCVFEAVRLEADSFQIQLELTLRTERKRFRILEVPFVLENRKVGHSKFKLSMGTRYLVLMYRELSREVRDSLLGARA